MKKKKTIIISSIVVLLLIVGLVLFLVFKKNKILFIAGMLNTEKITEMEYNTK